MSDNNCPVVTTTTTVAAPTGTGTVAGAPLDYAYLKTVPGYLKIAEIIFSFSFFICCVANKNCSDLPMGIWSAFVGFSGFFFTIVLLICNLKHVYESYPQQPWLSIQLCYYAVWTVFFLSACACLATMSSWVFVNAVVYTYSYSYAYYYLCNTEAIAGSVFAFAAMAVFGYDTFLKYRDWKSQVRLPQNGVAGNIKA